MRLVRCLDSHCWKTDRLRTAAQSYRETHKVDYHYQYHQMKVWFLTFLIMYHTPVWWYDYVTEQWLLQSLEFVFQCISHTCISHRHPPLHSWCWVRPGWSPLLTKGRRGRLWCYGLTASKGDSWDSALQAFPYQVRGGGPRDRAGAGLHVRVRARGRGFWQESRAFHEQQLPQLWIENRPISKDTLENII